MKVALIIIYNHQYNDNIEILENIYNKRFSNIYHLVPFYQGDKSNVIAIYENSYYFQGYVAQGLKHFFKNDYDHYFFIADDLILNPILNENNYIDYFSLDSVSNYITEFINLHEIRDIWQPFVAMAYHFSVKTPGVEIIQLLPEYNKAVDSFSANDLQLKSLNYDQISHHPPTKIKTIYELLTNLNWKIKKIKYHNKKFTLTYPIVGSYSDIFIISSKVIKEFCYYCGIFAAANLHVELAIPTSLVLSTNNIITEKELKLKGEALWTEEQFKILEQFQFNLNVLLEHFPKDHIYLHPIKLSKWIKS